MTVKPWQGNWQGRFPIGIAHQRSREVVRPTGGIVRGKFPSRKTGRMVHSEGLLESDAIIHFETSPLVVSYTEQHERFHYPDGAKLRRYTPDFELVLRSGETVLVEVKPSRNCQKEETRHKLDRIAEYLVRQQKPFVILTEANLRQEPRLANLRWLFHQAPRIAPSNEAMQIALASDRQHFPLSIKSAKALFSSRGVHPYSLLLAGLLHCDLEHPITPDTHLHITEENDNGWFYIEKTHGF